ncbi:MAG: phospholipase D-like domain-containing protein [Candidatus Krumholzibacteria bacterium]|jgi:phosphatidylserine/phosphatidylglycerophosphate/cardiolipin synthase-like enzyme|nr:phospholipase D-like domain-containing protein [Candidatus Krumholzibacteria bacterium]MDP6668925.1 phospholipase D-like domain-containing protein [Candidatus Krumholzibacteria bacterium]MDP6797753.1 phospholipase D-like domain-containing protein [Candidatus Krumholzibacteria bacterium]MDP7022247.1 phospholipase D-like domain-containing protein [Candidatus Krumholzibacteria bacterium]
MRLISTLLFLPALLLASGNFSSVSSLFDALSADSTLLGREISCTGQMTGDFFRDIYLQDLSAGPGTRGLRVKTGEHLAELGHEVLVYGILKQEKGEVFLKARRLEILAFPEKKLEPVDCRIGELVEDPELLEARLVRTSGLLARLLLSANHDPWLCVLETDGMRIDVELRNGSHPVLSDSLYLEITGIWSRHKDRWRLRPRSGEDFRIPQQVSFCIPAPHMNRTNPGEALLDEICFDPAEAGEAEGAESFAVVNTGEWDLDLSGWSISDHAGSWTFPEGSVLEPQGRYRIARKKERYWFEFGRECDFSFDFNAEGLAGNLVLDNRGDWLELLDKEGRIVDALVYGDAKTRYQPGWRGPSLQAYRFNFYVPIEGAVLLRKRDPATLRRLDSDRREDWISDPNDPDWGRQLNFAGWDREKFFDTARCEEEAELRAYVSPEHSWEGVRDFLRSAKESLEIEIYLITHPGVVEELLAAMDRGVKLTILLEGEVFGARGGTYDTVRGLMRKIIEHESGLGKVYLWRNGDDPRTLGPDTNIPDRYNHVHQKFVIADRKRLLLGSDNFTQSSLPSDDKGDGTSGSRGVFLVTDASCVLERAIEIWEADFDPHRHRDIRPFLSHPDLKESLPRLRSSRAGYPSHHEAPFESRELAAFELLQSPETFLRPDRGYLGLIHRAGKGDRVLVEQQYERPHWGYADQQTPNPRLQACIEAARRGAVVQILLSGNRPTPKSEQTREDIAAIAEEEGLEIEVRLGYLPGGGKRRNPIHNKMLLVDLGEEQWSHVGSANGSETASRYNRELGLSVRSADLFDYLSSVFDADWEQAGR